MLAALTAFAITSAARLLTGARALWLGSTAQATQRLYYANHSSHGDFVLLWASLPPELRKRTRPVAGADYWQKPGVRSFLINKVFNGVLVDRERKEGANPLQAMLDALDGGDSLIIFPEGTRNLGDEPLLSFKSGLYHLAQARPDVELVPVWIANLNRVMPKSRSLPLPLPLLCSVSFGAPMSIEKDEDKDAFLQRARLALLELAPKED